MNHELTSALFFLSILFFEAIFHIHNDEEIHTKTMRTFYRQLAPLSILLCNSLVNVRVEAFQVYSPLPTSLLPRTKLYTAAAEGNASVDSSALEEIRSMRVKELKEELKELKISTADVFEKEELVQRLYRSRLSSASASSSSRTSTKPASNHVEDAIRGPLLFVSMDAGRRVAANNDRGITIDPSNQPYASIQVQVPSTSGKSDFFKLTLLVDTACSGLVLRPSVVQKYNLPSISNPVTMTGAGGTTGATGLTQLNRLKWGGESFGPMPAAVQDIGALPTQLDGIIGLSFLNQFACVEMDFRDKSLVLYKKERRPPIPNGLAVVAVAEMKLAQLGIWVADVLLDGRGPVTMLVDSGAANTFLNWKGVEALGLSRDSPLVRPTPTPTGALGSDNVAMELTHRIMVQQNVNLGRPTTTQSSGLTLASGNEINVDIGNIAVLDALASDNCAGILGIDVLMQCKLARFTFNGPVPRVSLLN